MQQQPTAQSLPLVRLRTLGPFVFERLTMQEDHEPTYIPMTTRELLGKGKAITMLKILLCQRRRRATRDKLMDLLWTEDEQQQLKDIRDALKTTAVTLRDLLRVGGKDSLLLTIAATDELMIAAHPLVWVDADAFEALVSQAVRDPAADTLPLWERAHALAGGEFLEDEPYSEWATPRREALHGKIGQCTVALADLYTAHNRLDLAQEILWDATTAEYPNEDALCRLLLLLERQERYHDAWNLYKNTKRDFVAYERKLTPRLRELGKRLREKLEGIEPYTVTSSIVLVPSASAVPEFIVSTYAPNELITSLHSSSEVQEHSPLTLGISHLGQLFNSGWSLENIISMVEIVLKGIQGIPSNTRQSLFTFDVQKTLNDVPFLKYTSLLEYEQAKLNEGLSESIAASWRLFLSLPTAQVLTLGQTLLFLVQRSSPIIYPTVLPLFYSPIYRLIGAAFFFQARYTEALRAHEQAYITGLQANDAWNMAESLAWQAGVWKACGKHHLSIQLTEQALHLVNVKNDPRSFSAQARLFAQWAESAALLNQPKIAAEKLEVSAVFLDRLEANDEFDTSIWHYYRGTCAYYLNHAEEADDAFQLAKQGHQPNWTLQHTNTMLLQAKARLNKKELEGSLEAARLAFSLVLSMDSPLLSWGFIDYINTLQSQFSSSIAVKDFTDEVRKRLTILPGKDVSRYLEAELA